MICFIQTCYIALPGTCALLCRVGGIYLDTGWCLADACRHGPSCCVLEPVTGLADSFTGPALVGVAAPGARLAAFQHHFWQVVMSAGVPKPVKEPARPANVTQCADIECYTAVDTMLEGADVVLQGTIVEGANNLAMASRPGQSFWQMAWSLIEQRSQNYSLVDNVLLLSGPDSLSDALQSYLNLGALYWQKRNGDNVVHGDTIRVWPAGTFMCPCFLDHQ